MEFRGSYERLFGHLNNKQKSYFVLRESAAVSRGIMTANVTGFVQKFLPIQYLGSNRFVGRKIIQFFEDMIFKIAQLLSLGGRLILIKGIAKYADSYSLYISSS